MSTAAGQANDSAVNYHFGSREGLVDASLMRHSAPIHLRYDAQLDLLERQGPLQLRALIETQVRPIVAKLDDPDGAWEYLSLAAQLAVNPRLPLVTRPVASTPPVLRLMSAMWNFSVTPPALRVFHFERVAALIYLGIASWHRMATAGTTQVSREAFEEDLIDAVVTAIAAPPSEATMAAYARGKQEKEEKAKPERRAKRTKSKAPRD